MLIEPAREFVAKYPKPQNGHNFHEVPLRNLRYEYGFGFGDLYHPYTQALRTGSERAAADLIYQFSVALHRDFLGKLEAWQALPVQYWRHSLRGVRRKLEEQARSVHFGGEQSQLEANAQRRACQLFILLESIEASGFRFEPESSIEGVRVKGGPVLLLGGQHRTAVLDFLGQEAAIIDIRGRRHTPRNLRPLTLPLVRSGVMPLSDAKRVIERVRVGFSNQDAKELGFPFA